MNSLFFRLWFSLKHYQARGCAMNFTKRLTPIFSSTDHQPAVVNNESGIEQLRNRCQQLLAQADVNIDGSRPWDIRSTTTISIPKSLPYSPAETYEEILY